MRLVMIEWIDSYGCSTDWKDIGPDDSYDPEPVVCRSVGWLLHDGMDHKIIIPHIGEIKWENRKQGCGDMTIPVVSIVSIRDLSVVEVPKMRDCNAACPCGGKAEIDKVCTDCSECICSDCSSLMEPGSMRYFCRKCSANRGSLFLKRMVLSESKEVL